MTAGAASEAVDPIGRAAGAALEGKLVVLPTETVYGLGTRPDDPSATAALFDVKGRPRGLELPVLVPSVSSARRIGVFDERADALALRFWAGPLTIVVPRSRGSIGWDLGGDGSTIGLRMPHHPLTLAVLARTGPLAVTSANRSGAPTPSTCEELEEVFGQSVEVYLCEPDPLRGLSSTVVDLAHGPMQVLRAGAVSERDLHAALA